MEKIKLRKILAVLAEGESFYVDYEIVDSDLVEYFENATINFILKSLSQSDRIDLYKKLDNENPNDVYKYLVTKIPEFEISLQSHIKNSIEKVLLSE